MISVIVPVYNVEQYLLRCLESIARQTFKDFEVILVDDGSTDQSGQICDKFCQTNHNFKCIHQENQGLSEARNKGLYYAKGDYFCFIDSDDYVHPRMLEVLFHATNKTNSDISMVGIQETNGMLNFREINEKEPRIIYQEEMLHSIFNDVGIYLFHIVCNKLYRMRLKKIVFNQVENEDTDYNIRVFLSVEKMAYVETPLYYYYQRQGSIVRNQQYQNLHIINAVLHYFDYLDYIPQEKYVIRKECIKRLFKNYLSANYLAKSTKDTVIITYFKEKLDGMDVKILKSISSCKALPFYMKLFMTLLLKMPFFYYLFRKTMEIKAIFY